jgi:putrescine transport system permease protein
VRLGVKPEINAISTVMIAVVAVLVVLASILSKHYPIARERKAALAAPV